MLMNVFMNAICKQLLFHVVRLQLTAAWCVCVAVCVVVCVAVCCNIEAYRPHYHAARRWAGTSMLMKMYMNAICMQLKAVWRVCVAVCAVVCVAVCCNIEAYRPHYHARCLGRDVGQVHIC